MQGKFDLKFFHFINYSLKIPKCLLDAGPRNYHEIEKNGGCFHSS